MAMAGHQGQAYGQDLRDRVLGAPGSIAEVAARFGVSQSDVARARSRRRRLGVDTPGAQHNHVPLKLSGLEAALAARIQAVNDQTLEQLCQWVHATHGIRVGTTTMCKTLARLQLRLKKRHSMPPSRSAKT
jgi:transposase